MDIFVENRAGRGKTDIPHHASQSLSEKFGPITLDSIYWRRPSLDSLALFATVML